MLYPMEYRFADQVLKMNLVAKSVKVVKIENKLFDVPSHYEKVSKDRIDKMLEDLMTMSS